MFNSDNSHFGKATHPLADVSMSTGNVIECYLDLDDSHADIISRIESYTQSGERVVIISTDCSEKKTVLFGEFLSVQRENSNVISLQSSVDLNPSKLSQFLQAAIGCEVVSTDNDVSKLIAVLDDSAWASVLLVINDAHELSSESWQFLLRLIGGASSLQLSVSLVAFADPSVQAILSLCGSDVQICHLKSPEKIATSTPNNLFDKKIIWFRKKIEPLYVCLSKKISVKMNGMLGSASRFFQLGQIMKKSAMDLSGLPKTHRWTLVGLVVLLPFLLMTQGLFDEETENLSPREIVVDLELNAGEMTTESEAADEIQLRKVEYKDQVSSLENRSSTDAKTRFTVNTDRVEAAERKLEEGSNSINSKYSKLATKEQAKVNSESFQKPPSLAEKGVPVNDVPVNKVQKPISKSSFNPILSEAERWLLAQPLGAYSLQMLGSQNKLAVESFIARMGSGRNWHLIETWNQGKPWFIALYGSYDGREDASRAIKSMSPALKSQKPWAKALEPLQKSLKSR